MIAINKGTIAIIVLAVASYHYLSSGDVTLIPPTKSDVRDILVKEHPNSKITRDSFSIPTGCNRVGGGIIKQGIYTCKIEFDINAADKLNNQTITITKKNGKWIRK